MNQKIKIRLWSYQRSSSCWKKNAIYQSTEVQTKNQELLGCFSVRKMDIFQEPFCWQLLGECNLVFGCSPLFSNNCGDGFPENVVDVIVTLLGWHFLVPELGNAIN